MKRQTIRTGIQVMNLGGKEPVCPMKKNVKEFGNCDSNPTFAVYDVTRCYIGHYCDVHSNMVIDRMENEEEV